MKRGSLEGLILFVILLSVLRDSIKEISAFCLIDIELTEKTPASVNALKRGSARHHFELEAE